MEGLRRLMARREMDREGITVDPEHVLITNGSMQAVTLAVETLCTGEDDVVVMEELSYSGSIVAFGSMGIEMAGVPVDGDGMVMEALEETLEALARQGRRPRCIYTLATYQNPTGTVMPRSRRLGDDRHRRASWRPDCRGQLLRRRPLRRRRPSGTLRARSVSLDDLPVFAVQDLRSRRAPRLHGGAAAHARSGAGEAS